MDLPVIHEKSEFEKKGWKPTNYDERFLGPMRLRTALALSRNAVTVGLLEKIGLDKTIEFARKAGITSPISYDYTTALGSSAVTPLELTSAYATFASQGVRDRADHHQEHRRRQGRGARELPARARWRPSTRPRPTW